MSQIYWTGVCENRFDPLKLGRCQVRIFGLHTSDKTDLPTDCLPWAYPVQPITSAAISGIGHAPVGPVEGTWVLIIFRDGDCQQPLMLGTMGGIAQDSAGGRGGMSDDHDVVTGLDGSLSSASSGGTPTKDVSPPAPNSSGIIGPLATLIAKAESGAAKYNAFNRGTSSKAPRKGPPMNLVGMQISEIIRLQSLPLDHPEKLFACGMYQCIPTTLKEAVKMLRLDTSGLFNEKTQDIICQEYLLTRKPGRGPVLNYLKGTDKNNEDLLKKAGHSLAAEFASIEDPFSLGYPYGGPNGRYVKGGNKVGTEWASELRPALIAEWDFRNGDKPPVTETLGKPAESTPEAPSPQAKADSILTTILKVVAKVTNIPAIGELNPDGSVSNGVIGVENTGFADPSGKYPLYTKEPDTNRLAINNNIDNTIIISKEAAQDVGVPIANGGSWDQSPAPYNAQYPFNHVFQSESGHLLEFDDTTNSERVHIYHKSGSFTEWDANGTRVSRIVGDGFEILERNGYVHVKGALNVTVDGAHNLRVDNVLNVEVSGVANINIYDNANINVSGDSNMSVAGNFNLRAANIFIESDGEISMTSGTTTDIHSGSDTNVKSDANVNIESVGDTNVKSTGSTNLSANKSTNIKSSDLFNIQSSADINLKSQENININPSKNLELKGGATVNIEGYPINSGKTAAPAGSAESASGAAIATLSGLDTPDSVRGTSSEPKFADLPVVTRGTEVGFDAPDTGDYSGYATDRINSNAVSAADIGEEKIVLDSAQPNANQMSGVAIPANCEVIFGLSPTQFNPSMKLSKHFSLGELTTNGTRIPKCDYTVKGVKYTPQQIICNLKGLCVNVLDPIADKYGKSSFIITSAFRRPSVGNIAGDLGAGRVEGGDHPIGCAADIQFSGGKAKMFEVAKDLVTLLPAWNQIMLEYDGKSVWIHVSFHYSGNKGQYFTMNHHKTYGGTFPKGGFILI